MVEYDRRLNLRVSAEQEKKLKEKAAEMKYGARGFSSFLRDSVLENNGIKSAAVRKDLYQLRWEINKIGTNINQATRRINSCNGTREDIVELLSNQEQIVSLLETYLNKVEDLWQ